MDCYKIVWKKTAIKELRKIPKNYLKKITDRIADLSVNPYPGDCVKIRSKDFCYRMRISDYRIVYSIQNELLVIEIIRIKHRKNV